MFRGDFGMNIIGGMDTVCAGVCNPFLDALHLPGIGFQILLQRLIDDVITRPVESMGNGIISLTISFAARMVIGEVAGSCPMSGSYV